ncbi:hypothetical protein DPMN_188651 [Dreissena polymorpha]|uniref:Uncharacterized protein n=1 Tax=Dreissena polymorpha TaxID=45954 RepID=A0A9D4DU64_DREPO|nr:hypothetical protein DPMN_188651 [Dreissena polymorpha]
MWVAVSIISTEMYICASLARLFSEKTPGYAVLLIFTFINTNDNSARRMLSMKINEQSPTQWRMPRECGNRILKAFANSFDPDETPQNVASHQDPNCLLF